MKQTPTEPKDLKPEFGTKKGAFWTNIRNKALTELESSEAEIIINKGIIEIAERIIREEKEKLK